jgi:hypothetical protein
VDWKPLLWQSTFFLGIEHGFRFATEPGTRREIRGKFFPEYWGAIRGLGGWRDSDPFLVNYIGHPMQGAVTGHLFSANSRSGRLQEFALTRAYWGSRLRAMAWSAAYSTQFELGPLSEASLGNLGSSAVPGAMGWVDLVVTPAAGLGVQTIEDFLDRFAVRPLEERIGWAPAIVGLRGVLNPARSFSNAMRLKVPWHRDSRPGFRHIRAQQRASREQRRVLEQTVTSPN